jgi:hypothetical protein
MTEQPPEAPHDGIDRATEEQRTARALVSNDLANALVTLRNDMPNAAALVQEFINTVATDAEGRIRADETIRALANVILTLTNRIGNYAHELDHRAGDPDYFANKHARVVLMQLSQPVIRRLNGERANNDQN